MHNIIIVSHTVFFESLHCFVLKLQQAISVFTHNGHRVLVFGRQHMKRWEVYKQCLSGDAGWFFTQNVLVLRESILCSMSCFYVCGNHKVANNDHI